MKVHTAIAFYFPPSPALSCLPTLLRDHMLLASRLAGRERQRRVSQQNRCLGDPSALPQLSEAV